MIVGVSDFLTGLFRCGVETSGLVGLVRFGKGNLLVEPVDGAGRGPDDSGLRVRGFAGLEKRDEARDVAVDVRVGILHGVANPSLRREVHHVSESNHIEELRQEFRVVDIAFDDEDVVRGEEGLAGFFEGRIVVVVEVVESDDAVSASF